MNAPAPPSPPPTPRPMLSGFRIRLLKPSEQPQVVALLHEAGMYSSSVTLTPADFGSAGQGQSSYRARYGLGEVAGQAGVPETVGVMGLEQMPPCHLLPRSAWPAGGATLMRSFMLRQPWRGRGLSGHFTAWARAEARALGHHSLLLFTEPNQHIAAYWQRQGFVQIDPARMLQLAPTLPQVRHAVKAGWLEQAFAFQQQIVALGCPPQKSPVKAK